MWRTPQRLLLTYAGVVAGLGIVLAMLAGFADGWRIVGANVALLAAGCAVVARFGAYHNRRSVVSAALWIGIVLAALSAFNFLRLSIKWHHAQQVLMPESLTAAMMGLAGLITAVLLWRLVIAASHHSWTWHVRRLGTAAGVLAMGVGFIMTKAATLPQSASAMVQSAITSSDLAARLADTSIGDQLVESALRSKAVTRQLREQGLSEQQIEQLADDPQLRAAAFEMLRAGRNGQDSVNLSNLAVELKTYQASESAPTNATTLSSPANTNTVQELAAGMSRQELRQLGRSLNISAADLGIDASTAANMRIDDLEQHMNSPRVQELLRQQTSRATPPAMDQLTTGAATKTYLTTGAQRVKPDRVERRLTAEPVHTAASADARPANKANADIDQTESAPALSNSTQPRQSIARGLLNQTVLDLSDPSQTHVTLPVWDTPSQREIDSAPAAAHETTAAVSPADVAAIAEVVRSKMLQDATLPAGDLPEKSHWRLTPGFSLSRAGVVVLIIGGAIILCCIALGRNDKTVRAQPT